MKIDINYSEEKESHVGIYSLKEQYLLNGEVLHVLFPDANKSNYGVVIESIGTHWDIGQISTEFVSCTHKCWTKLNADSITFNLKD